jgi:hypothetical protein
MTDLIQRCEQADEGMQRELLVEAFVAVFGEMPKQGWAFTYRPEYVKWSRLERRFIRKLDAEAWESAARMLVPEGWSFSLGEMMGLPANRRWRCHLRDHNEPFNPATCKWVDADLATPALAIVSAALKAREASRG